MSTISMLASSTCFTKFFNVKIEKVDLKNHRESDSDQLKCTKDKKTSGDSPATSEDNLRTSGDSFATSEDSLATSGDSFATSGDSLATSGDSLATSGDSLATSGDSLATGCRVSGRTKVNEAESSSFSQPDLNEIQAAVKDCLLNVLQCDEQEKVKLRRREIPMEKVRSEIQSFLKTEGSKTADHASCEVVGVVKDNTYRISVSFNFFTTENVQFKTIIIEDVCAVGLDGSTVNLGPSLR